MPISRTAVVCVIVFVFLALSFRVFFYKPWTLSLYGDGETKMRLSYKSQESCLSAGKAYLYDERYSRFDCGYRCDKDDNLSHAILCKQVCNPAGCK